MVNDTTLLTLIVSEITAIGLALGGALLRFYAYVVKKLQNHEDRLANIERTLAIISAKIVAQGDSDDNSGMLREQREHS